MGSYFYILRDGSRAPNLHFRFWVPVPTFTSWKRRGGSHSSVLCPPEFLGPRFWGSWSHFYTIPDVHIKIKVFTLFFRSNKMLNQNSLSFEIILQTVLGLQDDLKTSWKCLQDVLENKKSLRWRRVQGVFKT